MMIIDVIREASDEYEIFFLLTAYVEAVRYCDKLKNQPEYMRLLPLAGTIDLEVRIDKLKSELARPSHDPGDKDRLIVREAADIFDTALHRLHALQEEKSMKSQYVENAGGQRRTGVRQSAVS